MKLVGKIAPDLNQAKAVRKAGYKIHNTKIGEIGYTKFELYTNLEYLNNFEKTKETLRKIHNKGMTCISVHSPAIISTLGEQKRQKYLKKTIELTKFIKELQKENKPIPITIHEYRDNAAKNYTEFKTNFITDVKKFDDEDVIFSFEVCPKVFGEGAPPGLTSYPKYVSDLLAAAKKEGLLKRPSIGITFDVDHAKTGLLCTGFEYIIKPIIKKTTRREGITKFLDLYGDCVSDEIKRKLLDPVKAFKIFDSSMAVHMKLSTEGAMTGPDPNDDFYSILNRFHDKFTEWITHYHFCQSLFVYDPNERINKRFYGNFEKHLKVCNIPTRNLVMVETHKKISIPFYRGGLYTYFFSRNKLKNSNKNVVLEIADVSEISFYDDFRIGPYINMLKKMFGGAVRIMEGEEQDD